MNCNTKDQLLARARGRAPPHLECFLAPSPSADTEPRGLRQDGTSVPSPWLRPQRGISDIPGPLGGVTKGKPVLRSDTPPPQFSQGQTGAHGLCEVDTTCRRAPSLCLRSTTALSSSSPEPTPRSPTVGFAHLSVLPLTAFKCSISPASSAGRFNPAFCTPRLSFTFT